MSDYISREPLYISRFHRVQKIKYHLITSMGTLSLPYHKKGRHIREVKSGTCLFPCALGPQTGRQKDLGRLERIRTCQKGGELMDTGDIYIRKSWLYPILLKAQGEHLCVNLMIMFHWIKLGPVNLPSHISQLHLQLDETYTQDF